MPAHGGDVITLQTDGTLMGWGEMLCKTPGESGEDLLAGSVLQSYFHRVDPVEPRIHSLSFWDGIGQITALVTG